MGPKPVCPSAPARAWITPAQRLPATGKQGAVVTLGPPGHGGGGSYLPPCCRFTFPSSRNSSLALSGQDVRWGVLALLPSSNLLPLFWDSGAHPLEFKSQLCHSLAV